MSMEVAQIDESEPRIASLLLQLVPVAQMRISQVSVSYSTRKPDARGLGCDSGTIDHRASMDPQSASQIAHIRSW